MGADRPEGLSVRVQQTSPGGQTWRFVRMGVADEATVDRPEGLSVRV